MAFRFPACLGAAALVLGLACSSSSSSTDAPQPAPAGTVAFSVSDASTEDWAVIGVKLLGVTLTPQGGGIPTTVYTTPAQVPVLNLVQLDNLSEVLGSIPVPAGTYTKATLTLGANPGDVTLVAANNPSSTFTGTPGAAIPAADIQIKGAQGGQGSLTTAVTVTLAQPLVVTAGQSANMDVEFNLSHPAFIVDHEPAAGGVIWTVNFNGTVRHRLVVAPEQMVLRHLYGTVTQVASGGGSLTLTRDLPTLPPTSPENATAIPQVLTLTPDTTYGTILYDLDAATQTTVSSFSGANLAGRYIRSVARFQPDRTLVAVRLWTSKYFNNLWASPEGHVDHVVLGSATSSYYLYVETGNGTPAQVQINNETQFFFRTPANAQADATPLATGTGFLDNGGIVRGFKVHVSAVDPTAADLVAQSVDIETAAFSGYLSNVTASGFTDTRNYLRATDDYIAALGYVPATTPDGNDSSGNPILGFKWWYDTLPTLADTGSGAITDFTTVTAASVDFGGSVGMIKVWGDSVALPALAASGAWAGWNARWTILEPVRLPKGAVVGPYTASSSGGSFTMTVKGGGNVPVTVDLSSAAGAATLVYQIDVDLKTGIYTVTPVDITTPAGVAALTTNLAATDPVVVYGVPQADGSIKAYTVEFTTTSAL
jgi:hypothetical protein